MKTTTIAALGFFAMNFMQGSAQASLQGRDLDGDLTTVEAYYDTTLDITWLKDTRYAYTSGYDADGYMSWDEAKTWVSNLSFYNPLTQETYGHWRLPEVRPVNGVDFMYGIAVNGTADRGSNISEQGTPYAGSTGSEMAHLFYNTLDIKSQCDPQLSGAGDCVAQADWGLLSAPFNVDHNRGYYWSGTSYLPFQGRAWSFTIDGRQEDQGVGVAYNAWAVHPGDVGAVPEPETYALLLTGLALIGWRTRRAQRPA
ncbi:MAG: PEP-CTERM sorting domain-containing protein [Thiobacillus sp.]|nr:PEP-CTERM sorting domain-containing protein [Thiobacillus sp.]